MNYGREIGYCRHQFVNREFSRFNIDCTDHSLVYNNDGKRIGRPMKPVAPRLRHTLNVNIDERNEGNITHDDRFADSDSSHWLHVVVTCAHNTGAPLRSSVTRFIVAVFITLVLAPGRHLVNNVHDFFHHGDRGSLDGFQAY